MLDYLQKFKQLPPEVKEKVSNKETSELISELEKKYDKDLVSTVMKVATRDIPLPELESYLINELDVSKERARVLEEELDQKVFSQIKDHLKGEASGQKKQTTKTLDSEEGDEKPKKPREKKSKSPFKKPLSFLPKRKRTKKLMEGDKEEDQEEQKEIASNISKEPEEKSLASKKPDPKKEASESKDKEMDKGSGRDASPKKEVSEKPRSEQAKKEKDSPSQTRSQDSDSGSRVGSKSGYFLSPEDEKEIQEISEKVQKHKGPDQASSDIETRLQNVIKEVDIKFSSEATRERFKKILSTYLKGVRKQADTRRTLAKDYNKGGLSLEDDTCDKIINVAKKYRQDSTETPPAARADTKPQDKQKSSAQEELDSILTEEQKEHKKEGESKEVSGKTAPEKGKKTDEAAAKDEKELDLGSLPQRDVDYDLASVLKDKKGDKKESKEEKEEKEEKDEDKKADSKASDKTPKGTENKDKKEGAEKEEEKKVSVKNAKKEEKDEGEKTKEKTPAQETPSKDGQKEKEQNKEREKEEDKDGVSSADQAPSLKKDKQKKTKVKRTSSPEEKGKKKMEDIKKPPKLINPVNELKYMDLAMFRRLGENAEQRADKVIEKIDNLSQKYFAEKLDGIKAWRQSPVNRMYLQIGRESIVYNKAVNDIIKEKHQEKEDYLTSKEFDAIMELNNKLRFY